MSIKSTEFSSLFAHPDKVIFCGYRDSGLLCLDLSNTSRLTFISTVASNDDESTIWFGKVTVGFIILIVRQLLFIRKIIQVFAKIPIFNSDS